MGEPTHQRGICQSIHSVQSMWSAGDPCRPKDIIHRDISVGTCEEERWKSDKCDVLPHFSQTTRKDITADVHLSSHLRSSTKDFEIHHFHPNPEHLLQLSLSMRKSDEMRDIFLYPSTYSLSPIGSSTSRASSHEPPNCTICRIAHPSMVRASYTTAITVIMNV